MFTSCPECGTVFRISTSDLRVAEGHVRCGHCSATFNALATLTDEAPATVAPLPARDPVAKPAEDGPGSDNTLEFDLPEDSWSNFFAGDAAAGNQAPAETAAEAEPAPEPEPEPEPIAEPVNDENSATDDIGAGIGSETMDQAGLYKALASEKDDLNLDDDADWQALLAEVEDDDATPDPVYIIESDPHGPAAEVEIDDAMLEILTAPDPMLPAAAPIDEPNDARGAELAAAPEPQPGPADAPDAGDDPAMDPDPLDPPWDDYAIGAKRPPAPLPDDFAADAGPDSPFYTGNRANSLPDAPEAYTADRPFAWAPPPPPPPPDRRWRYTLGSALLVVLLLAQMLHRQRDVLATNPLFTNALYKVYDALGVPLSPAWNLRAYEVRNYEAVADRSSAGALDILARIAVVGDERVGLPLVRVTLTDRFGNALGQRIFKPGEYLRQPLQPHATLSPGTLIPVEISLRDPGTDAQGIDVDICQIHQRDGIICQADRDPFAD